MLLKLNYRHTAWKIPQYCKPWCRPQKRYFLLKVLHVFVWFLFWCEIVKLASSKDVEKVVDFFNLLWKSKLFWIIRRFKKYLKSEGSRNQESTVFKLTMRAGILWRNVTFFIWRCKRLALLDAIFKVLYIVCIFKNCTHSCSPIFIVISIILINILWFQLFKLEKM